MLFYQTVLYFWATTAVPVAQHAGECKNHVDIN